MKNKVFVLFAIVLLGSSVLMLQAGVKKYTFANETFSDGTTGTIRAGVKTTNKTQVTVCDYYAEPNDQYLGQFQGDFASNNPGAVEQYCLDNYSSRIQ
jgi:hypothetical protein